MLKIFLSQKCLTLFLLVTLASLWSDACLWAQSNLQAQSSDSSSMTNLPSDTQALLERLGWSKAWLRRLHYDKRVWGKMRSRVDGQGFFFSPIGAHDPVAELYATLRAFQDTQTKYGMFQEPALCAFAGRRDFLSRQAEIRSHARFNIDWDFPCLRVEEYLRTFQGPSSISIVFSSAYSGNPASMFGHTFIKINHPTVASLRQWAINYSAMVPPNENGVAFAFFGVFGGYPGHWSLQPYHEKLKTYVQAESRDVWEYELDFSSDETIQLVLHLWDLETNGGYFDYYFFDENCSYQILTAIEAIKVDWDISQHTIYVIPGESVKNITDIPGAVRSVEVRKSMEYHLLDAMKPMRGGLKKQWKKLVNPQEDLPSRADPRVQKAAIRYYDYLDASRGGRMTPIQRERQKGLLRLAASQGNQLSDAPLAESREGSRELASNRPDLGHDSYSAYVGAKGWKSAESSQSLGLVKIRSAYHDILNRDQGFKSNSQIIFPSLTLVAGELDSGQRGVYIEAVDLLHILSLNPYHSVTKKFSWSLHIGSHRNATPQCRQCMDTFWETGFGGSLDFGGDSKILGFSLLGGRAQYSDKNKQPSVDPMWHTGILMRHGGLVKSLLTHKVYFLTNDSQVERSLAPSVAVHPTRNSEIRLSYERAMISSSSLETWQMEFGIFFR